MLLEFELKLIDNNTSRVVYEVMRKGLEVGILTLDAPYNEKEVLGAFLEMKK